MHSDYLGGFQFTQDITVDGTTAKIAFHQHRNLGAQATTRSLVINWQVQSK
jgi:hypothetical protein